MLLVSLMGCAKDSDDPYNTTATAVSPTTTVSPQTTATTTQPQTETETTPESGQDLPDTIDGLIATMNLKQKIAQLFIVDFYGMTGNYHSKAYNDAIDVFLREFPVGGVIYFAENIESKEQLLSFNKKLQDNSSIPLFISIDEEGGLVSRLGNADVGVDHLPHAATLSKHPPKKVKALAKILGSQMKSLGFNMDFAPVMDVDTNPDNPVIGIRSFGTTPDIVSRIGTAFIEGLSEAGIVSSAKHFPGHGDTNTDSHLGVTVIEHDMERLSSVELEPFKAAIETGVPSVMIGHITAPVITGNNLPASLSAHMISGLLREELAYDGLVLTDSLRMAAITDNYAAEEVGVMLLEAGGDIILIPDDFEGPTTAYCQPSMTED